jgi:pyrrolidone-carboxylate peptidase
MARPRVLVTGFGPFPGFADNPSAWLVETLAKRPSPEFKLEPRILPTEWEEVALIPRLYTALQPHVMIHFGVSERAPAFYIERSAHNRAARAADARGTMPTGRTIRADGPQRFDTTFSITTLSNGPIGRKTSRLSSSCTSRLGRGSAGRAAGRPCFTAEPKLCGSFSVAQTAKSR